MGSLRRNTGRVLFGITYMAIIAFQSIWVAAAFHVLSRLAYLGFVGWALRAQTQSQYFTRRYGTEAGFARFRSYASFIMNNDGLSFFVLAVTSHGTLSWGLPFWFWILNGAFLTAVGVYFKVWAKRSLSDTGGYYWKDFFIPSVEASYVPTGPYQFFKNPMYTIGSAHLYGIPLMFASWPGVVFGALFDHMIISVLYFWIERPHYIRLYSPSTGQNPQPGFVLQLSKVSRSDRAA